MIGCVKPSGERSGKSEWIAQVLIVTVTLATPLFQNVPLAGLPFVIGGGLKIVYDLLVLRAFSAIRPPEEQRS